ncbi:MAG: M20/M25/M40 family metallo-hydrolase [Ignavibacteria bacterium]|nr:M20/M25/M40 family metallo-hydrolase [Ignavibacteria bacterium]
MGKHPVNRKALQIAILLFLFVQPTVAQVETSEKPDSAAIHQIIAEGTERSQVMEILSYLTDIYGPRLTGSPQYKKAAEWARDKLDEWELDNARLEGWGPFGRGWSLKRHSAHVIEPQVFPIISYPKAWSPGTNGTVTADVIRFDAETDSAMETYSGKLTGKFVLLGKPTTLKAHFEPEASHETEAHLLELANADMPKPRRRFELTPERRARRLVEYKRRLILQEEGALAILTTSRRDGGNIWVQAASVPAHPDTPRANRIQAYDPKAPKILPQVAVAAEHYNRMVRMLKKGELVRMEMNLEVEFFEQDSGYNVIAEIPGTDLKDEIVMIGAHFDSWHGGTGATDNGTGSAVCMEAMRILKALDLKPRRTIRIGLWGGEEQGLLGSKAHVKRYFGEREGPDSNFAITLRPSAEKFSVYFNNDNGTGKVRGVYMHGNDAVRPIFRAWLEPFGMEASTLTLSNTGGSDHLSFDRIGLPGFQFIQDDIEYFTRTWHSTMDVYERAQEDDLKQSSVIMAVFAYNSAMRDERIPRKPMENTHFIEASE